MPRLHQVSRSEATSEVILKQYNQLFGDRDPVSEPGTALGTRGDWWTVFAQSPSVFKHALSGFDLMRDTEVKINPILRELGQTRAAWAKGCQFVFSQHCKSLRFLGAPEHKIRAIPNWAVSTVYDDKERAVLAYADCLALGAGRVPDDLFDTLKSFLSDPEILELTYIICLYDMHAVMTKALRLEFDDRPDPIVEVPAPASFKGGDFLNSGPGR